MTRFLWPPDSLGDVDVGHPLWQEDGSVVYNCCWVSPAQSLSGSRSVRLMTIFYCLKCDIPPTWRVLFMFWECSYSVCHSYSISFSHFTMYIFHSPPLYSINISGRITKHLNLRGGIQRTHTTSCRTNCTDKLPVSLLVISFCMKTLSCFCFVSSRAPPTVFHQKFWKAIPRLRLVLIRVNPKEHCQARRMECAVTVASASTCDVDDVAS
jgi:hypothetical protein